MLPSLGGVKTLPGSEVSMFLYFWKYLTIRFFCLFVFVFVLLFRATPAAYGGSQARGQNGVTAASLYHSHSNTRSPTHWARPGIELESSWILVAFIFAVPQWELPPLVFMLNLIFITLGDGSEKMLLQFLSKCVLPTFSSKSFVESGLPFRS